MWNVWLQNSPFYWQPSWNPSWISVLGQVCHQSVNVLTLVQDMLRPSKTALSAHSFTSHWQLFCLDQPSNSNKINKIASLSPPGSSPLPPVFLRIFPVGAMPTKYLRVQNLQELRRVYGISEDSERNDPENYGDGKSAFTWYVIIQLVFSGLL